MCGIAGIVWQDPARPGDAAAARAMAAALAHRGPDGEGVEVAGPAALGHRRLSVVDLSPAGRQPLSNEDGSVLLVFNGEVFNHAELRAGLEARGHRFRSATDGEVIVHLYEERGAELVDALRGMFAFALWDVRARRLLLARDRAGQKPLHYRVDPDALRFASEPGALLADPSAPPAEPDPLAIHYYLHYGYVPSPESAFQGARKLPPAHVLDWRPGSPPLLRRYWYPEFGGADAHAAPRAQLLEELEARLEESVRLRLMADVPLGAFLSGGIDSGLIVSAMARLGARPRTFTVGFEEQGYDERGLARQVAAQVGAVHREQVVAADATALLPQLVRRYGEPFADSSALPTWHLAALAREDVTVALAGDGGDELFAGYLRHGANAWVGTYQRVPRPLRRALSGLVEALPGRPRHRDPIGYAQRFVRFVEQDPAGRNAAWGMILPPGSAPLLYAPELAALAAEHPADEVYRRHFAAARTDRDEERALWADFALYLPDDVLVKVDVATMAHGLEARAPFLDHTLVEWAMRLPLREKLWLRERKVILRRLARRRLPRAVARAPKRGFALPIDAWFRGPLLPLLRETALAPDARVARWLEPKATATLVAQHLSRTHDWRHVLWSILCLELWHREVLEPASAGSSASEGKRENQESRKTGKQEGG